MSEHRTEWDEIPQEGLKAKETELEAEYRKVGRERLKAANGRVAQKLREKEREVDVTLHEVRQALRRQALGLAATAEGGDSAPRKERRDR